ncbi:adenylate kinase family protein [Candidatus Bathyarchaeota archaeon]|nr:adenylate kinase family protein [Candidatus Bathyarchaeota archaeon]
MKERRVIIVTGTPGVGKSAVSRALSKELKAEYIDLTEFAKRHGLIEAYDKERETFVVDEDKVSRHLREVMKSLDTRYIVVDGHYGVFTVSPEEVYRVFVLRRHPAELKEILLSRGYSGRKLNENLASEILDVCLIDAIERCGIDKVCEIDVTSKDIKSIVDKMLENLSGRASCKVGVVDWLGELEREGRVDEFLKF